MDPAVVVHRFSYPETCRILVPGPGIEPMSPALQGGFLTTGAPGKPCPRSFKEKNKINQKYPIFTCIIDIFSLQLYPSHLVNNPGSSFY